MGALGTRLVRAASRVAAFLVLVAALPAAAQQPELVTDRPDQTESAVVVPKGWLQLEVGATVTRDETGGETTEVLELPGTLLRLGLSDHVELRLGWGGYADLETSQGGLELSDSGVLDAEVGAKVHLAPERGGRPEMALLFGASVPVGEADFSSDRVDPAFRFSAAHTLSESVGLGYNVGLEWGTAVDGNGDRSTVSDVFYSVAAGFGLSPRWGAFGELFGNLEGSSDAGSRHSVNGGLTYLAKPNLQLDAAAGVGLSDAADDWFVVLGFSVLTRSGG